MGWFDMICPDCGKVNIAGKKFCTGCGKSLYEVQRNTINDRMGKRKNTAYFMVIALLTILLIGIYKHKTKEREIDSQNNGLKTPIKEVSQSTERRDDNSKKNIPKSDDSLFDELKDSNDKQFNSLNRKNVYHKSMNDGVTPHVYVDSKGNVYHGASIRVDDQIDGHTIIDSEGNVLPASTYHPKGVRSHVAVGTDGNTYTVLDSSKECTVKGNETVCVVKSYDIPESDTD